MNWVQVYSIVLITIVLITIIVLCNVFLHGKYKKAYYHSILDVFWIVPWIPIFGRVFGWWQMLTIIAILYYFHCMSGLLLLATMISCDRFYIWRKFRPGYIRSLLYEFALMAPQSLSDHLQCVLFAFTIWPAFLYFMIKNSQNNNNFLKSYDELKRLGSNF